MKVNNLDKTVEKYLLGDKECFEIIYYETYKYIYITIVTLTGRVTYVDDLIQETYMKMLDSLPSYTLGTNFIGWSCTIARNITINYIKRRKYEEIYDINNEVFKVEDNNNSLLNYINILEGEEKEVVIYRIVFNLKFKEITKLVDKDINQVFYLYKKGIKRIKEVI